MDHVTAPSRDELKQFTRGIGLRQVRLASGIVLFSYLVSHFLNNALGNISAEALAWGVYLHTEFWQFLPVTIVFYSACLTHLVLGIWALYQRRQFGWKAVEPLQLILGLSIPFVVIAHIVGVRVAETLFGLEKLYPQVFYTFFVAKPLQMWLMLAMLIIAWVHGCIGLYFWLRIKRSFTRAAPYLLVIAVLIPTLAMLGVYQGGRSVAAAASDPAWRAENLSPQQVGTAAQQDTLDRITNGMVMLYLGLLGLALAGRGIRALRERRLGMIRLSYGNGRTVRVPKGFSVLEASLRHKVPHASVCGGRARCSTCRIRITSDVSALPEPSAREAFVLGRLGVSDPSIRLACQLRPNADLSFFQLLQPHAMSANAHAMHPARIGKERYLVSLFVDMRGSTRLAEGRLPFDTVFIVNRFLGAVAQAVIECGGTPNQFLGDGMLALFGLATDREQACRQALHAATMIAANVGELNQALSYDLAEPLRFGVGIHGGEVIIGDVGYRDHMVFTALGDAVNVAARLQDLTKSLSCEVIISDEVRHTAGLPVGELLLQNVAIRGRNEPMLVCVVTDTRQLAALAGETTNPRRVTAAV